MTAVPTAVRRDLRGKACCSGTLILLGGRTAPGTHGAGGELQGHCPGGTGQGRPPSTGRAALCGRPPPPSGHGAQRGSAARLLLPSVLPGRGPAAAPRSPLLAPGTRQSPAQHRPGCPGLCLHRAPTAEPPAAVLPPRGAGGKGKWGGMEQGGGDPRAEALRGSAWTPK